MENFKSTLLSLFSLQGFVVVGIFTIYGTAIFMLMFKPMPMTEAAGTLLTSMVGVLTGAVVTIVTFFYGSSKQSQTKDETIQKLSNGEK